MELRNSKSRKRLIIWICVCISVCFTLFLLVKFYTFFFSEEENIWLLKKTEIINLPNGNKTVYIEARIWGLAGNHEEIRLSLCKDVHPADKLNDYIFYTREVYYKVENDSILTVYASRHLNEPINKIPNVLVKTFKNSDEIIDYEKNYEKYGLKRVSAIQK